MKWNERLKRERSSQGWTQSSIAKAIGTSTSTVNRWENGKVFPSPFYRQHLSRLFGKSIEELGLIPEDAESGNDMRSYILSALELQLEYQSGRLKEEEEKVDIPSDPAPNLWKEESLEQNTHPKGGDGSYNRHQRPTPPSLSAKLSDWLKSVANRL